MKQFWNDTMRENEQGFGLIEALAAIALVGIMAMSIMMNAGVALRTAKLTEVNYAASTLAASKVEDLAAVSVANLDSSFNETENSVSWSDFAFTFSRTTTVVVNADDSRTVTVLVTSNDTNIPTSVNFQTTFAKWE